MGAQGFGFAQPPGFLRKDFVAARRFDEKPGFFAVRKSYRRKFLLCYEILKKHIISKNMPLV